MAPPKRPWFRFYTEALTDPKLRRLTPAQRWLFVAVLGAARSSCVPGVLLLTEREPLTAADLADLAGMPEKATKDGLAAMDRLGLIQMDDDLGAWRVPKWGDRQFESDDTTARTSKHRKNNPPPDPDPPTMERSINGEGTHQRQRQRTETEPLTSSTGSTQVGQTGDDEWMASAVGAWADAFTAHRAKTKQIADPISYAAGCRKKPDPKVLIELERLRSDEPWLSPAHAGRVAAGERGLLNLRPLPAPEPSDEPATLEQVRQLREARA